MANPDPELVELVAALKHDLGKYVAWRSANLDDGVWEGEVAEELLEALGADLLRTRQHRDGAEAAWDVWDRLAPRLPAPQTWPGSWPELVEVAEAVERLRGHAAWLAAGDRAALARHRAAIRSDQGRIRDALRRLSRRV